jgi:hypothetical protein
MWTCNVGSSGTPAVLDVSPQNEIQWSNIRWTRWPRDLSVAPNHQGRCRWWILVLGNTNVRRNHSAGRWNSAANHLTLGSRTVTAYVSPSRQKHFYDHLQIVFPHSPLPKICQTWLWWFSYLMHHLPILADSFFAPWWRILFPHTTQKSALPTEETPFYFSDCKAVQQIAAASKSRNEILWSSVPNAINLSSRCYNFTTVIFRNGKVWRHHWHKRRFCKSVIYRCHYGTAGCHSNIVERSTNVSFVIGYKRATNLFL